MNPLRDALHRAADLIADAIEVDKAPEWIDQNSSPLGKSRHLSLVRRGVLQGHKDGRRVLVRRTDIEAYLTKRQVIKVNEKAEFEREVAKILAAVGPVRRSA